MTATPADDLSLAAQVDTACDRFESEFRAGQRPRLEAFLAELKEPNRARLFQSLLEVELELRQSQGKSFRAEDYSARFPEYLPIIDEAIQRAREFPGKRSSVIITGVETSRGPTAKKANPPPANVSLPLSTIGRFQVVALLGEGAFGSVYQAHDPQLDREVAIKVPRSASHRTVEERERFLREGRAAAALHHPNICPVYEVGTTPEGRDYIVMAFIEGRPLSRVLQAPQRLSDRQIVNAVRRLALALEEAHAKGIIHRDLKPANIMINRKGEPVIMDFGLARRATATDAQLSHSGQIMGTPAYMSPEQARGDVKGVGPLSDLYSLGLVMYEMLCGRRPFEGTVTEVIGQILHVEPPPPSQFRKEIDPHLESICLKAIAKRPDDRFASMKDFATALSQYATTMANAKPGAASSAKDALGSGDLLHTEQLAKLVAAVSSDVESKINRAAGRMVRQASLFGGAGRPPLWVSLAGSGFMGLVVLLGILFFVRAGDTTILIHVPLPDGVDLTDTSLAFFLDEKPISAEQIGQPIDLTPGEHELVIRRGEEIVERMRFEVVKEGKNGRIEWKGSDTESGSPQPAVAPFTAEQAREHQEAWAKHLGVPVEFTNSIGMKFRLIPPGEYSRGTPADEYESVLPTLNNDPWLTQCLESETPVHQVRLTQPFYLGTYEVTQRQYEQMVGANPSQFSISGEGREQVAGKDTSNLPVERVNWDEALDFCSRLSQSESLVSPKVELRAGELSLSAGDGYRLPTEAEWEYACRAGTTSRFWTGENAQSLDQAGWYAANSEQRTHAVGKLRPNPFGLFDIHGNAYEWVQDWWNKDSYKPFAETLAVDPLGAAMGSGQPLRVVRGGFMGYGPNWSRAAHRNGFAANTRFGFIGFRVVISVDGVKKLLSSARKDSDRAVAEWVLSKNGGAVRVAKEDLLPETLEQYMRLPLLTRVDQLPADSFQVVGITLAPRQPDEADLARLDSLQHLKLLWLLGDEIGDNQLSRVSRHRELFALKVDSQRVTNEGLVHFGDLNNLVELDLGGCRIDDAGLDHLAGLQRLYRLDLSRNSRIGDDAIRRIEKLPSLTILNLEFTSLTDRGVKLLKELKPLRDLNLIGTQISGANLEVLAALSNLEQLHLDLTSIGDEDVAKIAKITTLRSLFLDRTRIGDEGLARLSPLLGLRQLSLVATDVTAEGIPQLESLKRLEVLNLIECDLTDSAVDALGQLTSVRQLHLGNTLITPEGMKRLRSLLPNTRITPELSIAPNGSYALEFSGRDSYVIVPGLNYDGSFPITVEAWVRMDRLHDSHIVYFPGPQAVVLNYAWNSLGFFRFDGPRGEHRHASFQPEPRRWYHIAGVWDRKEIRFYIDGRRHSIDHGGWNGEQPGETLYIGGEPLNVQPVDRFLRGAVDEVRVSRIARYQGDFVPSARFDTDEQTIALYHFDEGEGTVASDASGNHHDGRIVNAKWIASRTAREKTTPASDWTELFNGQNLAGWKVSGPADWSVRDGAVFVDGSRSGELTCERQFNDFELTGEVFTTAKANGGILFRRSSKPINNVLGPGGYEFQVAGSQGDPGRNYTGGLYEGAQSAIRVNPPVAKDDAWTPIRLRVEGNHLQGWVNEQLTFDVRGKPERLAGSLLKLNSYSQGGEVGYRNFRIRSLTATSESGWVSLFNGKDLAGWRMPPNGPPNPWKVENGILTAQTGLPMSMLLTERGDYRDVHLRAEAKFGGGRAGIKVRTPIDLDPHVGSYTLAMYDSSPPPERGPITAFKPPLDTWLTLEMIVRGYHVKVLVDGKAIDEYDDRTRLRSAGHIALPRSPNGKVSFRKIEVMEFPAGGTERIPGDARTFNGHSYKFFPEQLSWKEAKARCESMGGRLVMVETLEENAFVASLVAEGGKVDAWIGATDEGSEGQWRWVDGHLMTWTNWHTDQKQPNNKGGVEHFGLMSNLKLPSGKTMGWQWSDQPNESTQHQPGYVCEWE